MHSHYIQFHFWNPPRSSGAENRSSGSNQIRAAGRFDFIQATKSVGAFMVDRRLCRTSAHSANKPDSLISRSVTGGSIFPRKRKSATASFGLDGSSRPSATTSAKPTIAGSPMLWYRNTRSPDFMSRIARRACGFRTPSHTVWPSRSSCSTEYVSGSVFARKYERSVGTLSAMKVSIFSLTPFPVRI
jgi:hypothetical protein